MIVKEMWAVLRDPRGRIILVFPPLMQLLLFASASTLEVKNVSIGVYNGDGGPAASEFINQLAGSPNVKRIMPLYSADELKAAIDDAQIIAAVIIDEGFSRNVAAKKPAEVGAILDGRRSNASQLVGGYLLQIAANVGATLRPSPRGPGRSAITNWFNPNLNFLWFILPALLAQISALSAMGVTSQSVARERELGTFDQLMVSPLRLHEILIGKMTPPFIAGVLNTLIYLVVIPGVYGVHMLGSHLLFFGSLLVYLIAIIGLGMMLSAIAHTQQQAFLGMFVCTVPMMLLSGFASPVENMPPWLQFIAGLNPLKHFLVVAEGLYLKGMSAVDVVSNSWPLAIIALVMMGSAVYLFRSRME